MGAVAPAAGVVAAAATGATPRAASSAASATLATCAVGRTPSAPANPPGTAARPAPVRRTMVSFAFWTLSLASAGYSSDRTSRTPVGLACWMAQPVFLEWFERENKRAGAAGVWVREHRKADDNMELRTNFLAQPRKRQVEN